LTRSFQPKEHIAGNAPMKTSAQRNIRNKVLEQIPFLALPAGLTVLDLIWPKKETLSLVKCRDHISIYAVHGEPIFFQHFDGPFYPTLKVLHRFPGMLPRVGVDRGAIKFVLSGANIMCPGMTSPTGYLPPSSANLPKGTPVAVYAYGKENPLAIGLTTMSTDDIREINKNIGVENVAFLGDDLWKVDKL
ncbi:PUA-like domain-containing protein, partial [Rhodotorula diobovata]